MEIIWEVIEEETSDSFAALPPFGDHVVLLVRITLRLRQEQHERLLCRHEPCRAQFHVHLVRRHTNWLAVPKAADDLHHPDSAGPNGIWGLDRINQRVEQHGFLWEMAKGGRKGVLRCPVHVLFVLDPLCQIVLF